MSKPILQSTHFAAPSVIVYKAVSGKNGLIKEDLIFKFESLKLSYLFIYPGKKVENKYNWHMKHKQYTSRFTKSEILMSYYILQHLL